MALHLAKSGLGEAAFSKYCNYSKKFYDEKDLKKLLINFGNERGYGSRPENKGVLFPTSDDYVNFCVEHYPELSEFFHVPNMKGKNFADAIDKRKILEIAKENEIDAPQAWDLQEIIANKPDFDGEVILKARNSLDKKNLVRVKHYSSFDKLLKDIEKYNSNICSYVVEEFIKASIENYFQMDTYLTTKGEVIIGGIQKRDLVMYNRDGDVIEIAVNYISGEMPEIEKRIEPLVRSLDYNFPINFEFFEREGTDLLFEANCRTGTNVLSSTLTGLNIPAILYFDKVGKDYSHLLNKKRKVGHNLVLEDEVIWYLGHNGFSLKNLLCIFKGSQGMWLYKQPDKLPGLIRIGDMVQDILFGQ